MHITRRTGEGVIVCFEEWGSGFPRYAGTLSGQTLPVRVLRLEAAGHCSNLKNRRYPDFYLIFHIQ